MAPPTLLVIALGFGLARTSWLCCLTCLNRPSKELCPFAWRIRFTDTALFRSLSFRVSLAISSVTFIHSVSRGSFMSMNKDMLSSSNFILLLKSLPFPCLIHAPNLVSVLYSFPRKAG